MHGVKNDPGLIPTERELKLTVKTAKQSGLHRKEKDKIELMLDPTINTQTSKSNIIDDEIDTKGDESRLHGLTRSLITDTNSIVPSNNEEVVIEERSSSPHQPSTIPIMKYNPHVCPFCDQSFKQLPHLGAHIMAAHEPPTDDIPSTTRLKKLEM